MPAFRRLAPLLALLLVTAIWGWTFVIVRAAVKQYPVVPFLALRFSVATICLTGMLLIRKGRRGDRGLVIGLLPGVVLAASYLAQTEGLRFTTASKAGLLTGLFVVFTPLLALAIGHLRPSSITLLAVAGAFVGTVLLVAPGGSGHLPHEGLGDSLEVITAICLAIHILILGHFAPGNEAGRMALSQMATGAILFAFGSSVSGGFPLPTTSVWLAIGITGVLASAVAFWIQTLVQQRMSAARTAIVLTCEPVFATLFGLILAGDRFTIMQAVGGALIITAVIFHETVSGRRAPSRSVAI